MEPHNEGLDSLRLPSHLQNSGMWGIRSSGTWSRVKFRSLETNTLPRNIGQESPSDATSPPIRKETSSNNFFCPTPLVYPLGYRIKFQLPFNNIKWLSDYSRHWQIKGYEINLSNQLKRRYGVRSEEVKCGTNCCKSPAAFS